MEKLNTFDFLEEVFNGNVTENEMLNFIEKDTQNYQLDRVKNLRKSVGQLRGKLLFSTATTNFYHLDAFENILVLEASKRQNKIELESPILSMKQVALKLVYEGANVTKENADEVIRKFGYTSGHKLFILFSEYRNPNNRIADPNGTLRILKNKIKLFESIVDHLSDENKEKAKGDLEKLNYILIERY